MRKFRTANVCAATMTLLALSLGTGVAQPVTFLPQWPDQARNTFYSTSQGSRMMPVTWFKALKRLDKNEAFGADQLARYGYIANSPPNADRLPIGFVVDKRPPAQLGMTCAACHTNQLEYVKDGQTRIIRLDGAPTLADFQQFLTDLTAAAQAMLNDDTTSGILRGPCSGKILRTQRSRSSGTSFARGSRSSATSWIAACPPTHGGPDGSTRSA